ncbi:MAG TPA: vWA domain-containing protein [Polyangiaceae bacterium]|nr:vWA domain-containing protein [Polyangiaceae bacterium]
MPKSLLTLPIGLLALSCGLRSGDDDDGAKPATGGSPAVNFGGTNANGGSSSVPSGGSSTNATGGSISIGNSGNTGVGGVSSCAGLKLEPESLPAVLQIVLDNSLSMNTMTNATGGRSKWAVTREALEETITNLPGNIAIGLLYFPNMNTSAGTTPRDVSACVRTDAMVPIGVLGDANSAQRRALIASLDQTNPAGSTPTHDAYTYGLENSLRKTTAPGARFMMLMTDGGPTLSLECMGGGLLTTPQPTQPIIDTIRAARADYGIKSFLVGVPGTEDIGNNTHDDGRPWMSTAAVLAGTALPGCNVRGPNWCHIDLTQAADFSLALRQSLGFVTRQILTCEYEVPATGLNGEPINQNQINVVFTPAAGSPGVIKRDENADCTDGWQLKNGFVTLCPNSCDRLRTDSLATLEIEYGCDTVEVPIR